MKTAGLIGGMGAQVTAHFYTKLLSEQVRQKEQNYLDIIIYSKTSTPDRTAYILDNTKPNPCPVLVDAAVSLEKAGADFIVMTCITAHYFYKEISNSVNIPVINALDMLQCYVKDLPAVFLLATTGTIKSNLIVLPGTKIHILPGDKQAELMDIIYTVKTAADLTESRLRFKNLIQVLDHPVILGCTELSLVAEEGHIDMLDLLVEKTLQMGNVT